MAAGLGFKTFTTGEVLTAADTNGYLMQGVLVFASAAARDAAITSPQEGQFAYTKDTNGLWYYDGAAWVASGATGDIEGVTAGVGITGGGTSGTVTITNDMATTITASGDIVVGTGSGTYDNLPIGTTAQVLTADTTVSPYKVKWATPAAASSALTLISRTTFSGVASQTFDGVFTTTYENYIVYFNSMSAATSADDPYLALRYQATDVAGTVYFNRMAMSSGSSAVTGSAQSSTDFISLAIATGSSAEPGYGVMYFGNVGNVANKGNGWGQWNDGANGQASWFNGSFASGGAANKICTGFKVYTSSSNISGTVTIYGLAKS